MATLKQQSITAEQFANAILATMQIREDSWIGEPYNKYKKPIYQAAKEACTELQIPAAFFTPIYLICYEAWNDANDWCMWLDANSGEK